MMIFYNLISEVLSISFTLGGHTFSLGGIALGYILLKAGMSFFDNLAEDWRGDNNWDAKIQREHGMTYDEYSASEAYIMGGSGDE
jgi:hypothetical protein